MTSPTTAEVTVADFDVEPGQEDAAIERLAAIDFADIARPAATVLARQKPMVMVGYRDPRMTEAEFEVHIRKFESRAYTVARHVWSQHTKDDTEEVARVLADIATDRFRTKPDVRQVAIDTLASSALGEGTLGVREYMALYRVAVHNKDDPMLRQRAATALMYVQSAPVGQRAAPYDMLLQHLPGIIRAQPTLAERHAAFNDLTGIGNRLYRLPMESFTDLIRVGFELIEETPTDSAAGAYGTALRLGFMLRRPNEFKPPQDEHRDETGNLAPSCFLQTVKNARQWWDETGRDAINAIAPVDD